jgi:hypothetical protein
VKWVRLEVRVRIMKVELLLLKERKETRETSKKKYNISEFIAEVNLSTAKVLERRERREIRM